MSYERVFRALSAGGVRYLVVGGVAVNLYGVPRMTADVDLILALVPENVLAAVRALEGLGLRPRAPVKAEGLADPRQREEWMREKGMKAFSFHDPRMALPEVDLLLAIPFDFEDAWGRRHVERDGDLEIPVVSLADLIALKRGTGRAQDESDIAALERLGPGGAP